MSQSNFFGGGETMIKQTVLRIAAIAMMTTSATAADLVRANRFSPATTAYNWTGFYLGANAGYLDARGGDAVATPASANLGLVGAAGYLAAQNTALNNRAIPRDQAFVGGLQAGYNVQFGAIVVGLETDIQWAGGESRSVGVAQPVPGGTITGSVVTSQRYDYFGTVRGRLGYAVLDNLLVYGTGGLAYGRHITSAAYAFDRFNVFIPAARADFGTSSTRTGWALSAGFEYGFARDWAVKAEGLYFDMGTSTAAGTFTSLGNNGAAVFTTSNVQTAVKSQGVIARLGVNYKFGGF